MIVNVAVFPESSSARSRFYFADLGGSEQLAKSKVEAAKAGFCHCCDLVVGRRHRGESAPGTS